MGAERAEALEVLRDVWRSQAQTVADLDDNCETHCKKMTEAGVGFDEYGASEAVDRVTAWRARLEREGKLSPVGSIADLVLRQSGQGKPSDPSEKAETSGTSR